MEEREWDFKSFKIIKREYWDFKGVYIWEVCFEKWTEKIILQINNKDTSKILDIVEKKMPNILSEISKKYIKTKKVTKNKAI